MAKYRAPVLVVAQAKTKPRTATAFAMVMCLHDYGKLWLGHHRELMVSYQVRSFILPEFQEYAMAMTPDTMYGGHVSASVTLRLKPNVSTMVGKKFLKLLAAMWKCCIATRTQRFLSRTHSFSPFQILVSTLDSTVSRAILEQASWRSSSESHQVFAGSSGRMKTEMMARTKVGMPCMMKSHLHPERPATPLCWKTPIAMRPANAVPQMLPATCISDYAHHSLP